MRIKKEDYVARISNASPIQLVIINYELIIDYIDEATESAHDRDTYEAKIKKAQDALLQLINSLDMEYPIADELLTQYIYTNKLLITARFSGKTDSLTEARERLTVLLGGWLHLERTHGGETPVMQNTQQIFAGLTYRKDGLDEYVEDDGRRGYTV